MSRRKMLLLLAAGFSGFFCLCMAFFIATPPPEGEPSVGESDDIGTATPEDTAVPSPSFSVEEFIAELPIRIESESGWQLTISEIEIWDSIETESRRHRPEEDTFLVFLGSLANYTDEDDCVHMDDFSISGESGIYEMEDLLLTAAKSILDRDYPGAFRGQCLDYDGEAGTFLIFDVPNDESLILRARGANVKIGPLNRLEVAMANATEEARPTNTPTATPTLTPSPTPTVTPSLTPTATPTPAAFFTVSSNANLRGGPGTDYAVVASAEAGESLPVYARSEDGWLMVDVTGVAWIAGSLGSLDSDLDVVDITDRIPPTPTQTPTPTPTFTPSSTPTPTSTPTITPSPTPSPTSIPDSAGITDWMIYEGMYVGVREMRWDYTLGYFRADSGKIYVSFYVIAINQSDSSQRFSDFDFELIDGGGQITSGVVFGELDPDFDDCTVRPGGTCEGWWTTMIWDRPEVREDLTFRWEPCLLLCSGLETPIRQE